MNKSKSRTKLAFKNVFLNGIYQLVNTFSNIIIPPLLISKFGSAINGLISTIRQIVNYIQIVGAGISESSIVSLYKPLEDKDAKKISSIYNASSKSFNKAGWIFVCGALILSFIYPLLLSENLDYWFVVFLIISLSIAGASEFFALGKYRTLLIADQKQYIVNIAQVIGLLSSTLFTILLIKLDVNLVIVQFVSSSLYVLRICLLRYYVKKYYDFLDSKILPDYQAISKRKAALIHQIASLIIFGSQTLFIANYCGLKEASVYSVYALIFTGINTILSTVSSAMVAGMGNLLVSSDKKKIHNIFNIYEYGYYIMVFIFYTITFIMCLPFIKLYTSGSTDINYLHYDFVVLFSIMGLLNCLRTPLATMINAKGHYDETKNRAIIEMMICLCGEIILVGKYQVRGVLIATILAYVYRTVDVIIYSNKRILERSIWKTCPKIFINTFVFMGICFLSTMITFSINNYLDWIGYVLIIGIVVTIVFISVNYIYSHQTMKELKKYMLLIIRRKNDNKQTVN